MNLDERIKKELETEAEVIDEILNDKQGIFDLVAGSFKSGLGVWVVLINIVILVVTGLMIWSGYEFFIAEQLDDRIFWGVCLVISAVAQIAMKQWVWMEMQRSSLLREIKRVEIAIAKLASKVGG
jgi:hypothetical protein